MSSIEQENSIRYSDGIVTTADILKRLETINEYNSTDGTPDSATDTAIDAIIVQLDAIDVRLAAVLSPRQTDPT